MKSTTGDPPIVKFEPPIDTLVLAAPLSTPLGMMLLTAGARIEIVFEDEEVVVTVKVPVPVLASSAAGTVTLMDVDVGIGDGKTVSVVAEPPGGVNVTV